MQCLKCQFENPSTQKFCGKCGTKLENVCPNCGEGNPTEYQFCGGCGHDLSRSAEPAVRDLSYDEKLDKIQRYLPQGLTEKILSQRDKIEGERKTVTVMFCDMVGFTPLVEELGPEDAYSIMDQVYEILIHKVHDYEGTVNEMTGDGIMALFGAPIALEDAPQRAIRSAYAIHREITGLSEKIRQERRNLPALRMRVGIHTGPVVVGTLGNNLRVEFKAVGDTVNLASRMEELAAPGATYVTDEIFRQTEGLFVFEFIGEKEVKGKQEPVKTYQVIGPSSRRTRFDVSAERGLTPFVGREREFELLWDGFERAKQGRGQAFSIMAEAGMGKSRLLYEFRKAVSNEDVTFLEGKCLSYSRGTAYHPVIDVLKANFDIQDRDGDFDIVEKVKAGLKALAIDEDPNLSYFLDLLSVKDSGINRIEMTPESVKERTIEALNRIVLKGSEIQPLIMAIEDLHWIDKVSEEVLKDLLESIAGSRVFLLFTYRPDFVHTWGGRSYHNQVNLNRLSNRESLGMITNLIGSSDLESALEDLILEKSEGVPFFIEEFIQSLKDLNLIEKREGKYCLVQDKPDVTIPSTIQDVIMARVDSLLEGAKEVLQTGSAIEREFSFPLIQEVMNLPERELLSHLAILKDSELIFERGIFPDSIFIFKHALTREVVYDSILTKRRIRLHDQIGHAIETVSGDSIGEYYGILAEHFATGNNYEKGAEYAGLAARQARRKAAFLDAISYAKKSVDCIERLPQTDDWSKKRIDARTWLGQYYLQMSYHIESKEAIAPIVDIAIRSDYKRRLAQIYTILGQYENIIEENIPKSYGFLEEAVKIAAEIGDFGSISLANMFLGMTQGYNSDFEAGLSSFQKALEISVAVNSLWGISQIKSMISFYIYCLQGKAEVGYELSTEAVLIAEKSGDTHSKAMAHTYHGWSCINKGVLEEATAHLLKANVYNEKINHFLFSFFAHYGLGEVYFEFREYKKAKYHYNEAVTYGENGIMPRSNVIYVIINTVKAIVMNNENNIDLEILYSYEKDIKEEHAKSRAARSIGEILLHIDDRHLAEAEEWIRKAIERNEQNGSMCQLGMDYASYAELFKRKGDLSKAKETLGKAIEIMNECGADGWVEKYEQELAALS